MRIQVEGLSVPVAGLDGIAFLPRYVAELAQDHGVVRVEAQGLLENRACFFGPLRVVQRLAVDDVTAHVARLLRQMSAADRYRLLGVTSFPVFIGERREVPPRILVEFLP